MPVVDTLAPGPPPTAEAPTVEAPLLTGGRRDRTPLILGLLAVAAVVALGLSALAFARDDSPATPREPVGTEQPATELAPPPVAPTPSATSAPATTTRPAPTTSAANPVQGGKGKGGKGH